MFFWWPLRDLLVTANYPQNRGCCGNYRGSTGPQPISHYVFLVTIAWPFSNYPQKRGCCGNYRGSLVLSQLVTMFFWWPLRDLLVTANYPQKRGCCGNYRGSTGPQPISHYVFLVTIAWPFSNGKLPSKKRLLRELQRVNWPSAN